MDREKSRRRKVAGVGIIWAAPRTARQKTIETCFGLWGALVWHLQSPAEDLSVL